MTIDEMDAAWHKFWTEHVGTEGYNKEEWSAFNRIITPFLHLHIKFSFSKFVDTKKLTELTARPHLAGLEMT